MPTLLTFSLARQLTLLRVPVEGKYMLRRNWFTFFCLRMTSEVVLEEGARECKVHFYYLRRQYLCKLHPERKTFLCIIKRIRNLSTRRRRGVRFTLSPIYFRGRSPCYSLDKRLGELQSRPELCWEDNPLPLLGSEPQILVCQEESVHNDCDIKLSRKMVVGYAI